MISLISLIISLSLIMYLAYKGYSTIITAPIHGILEGLMVIPFGYSFYQIIIVVALGTILHHFVDGSISYALATALAKARRTEVYDVFSNEVA